MEQELMALLPNLRRFALSLTGSVADADDLLQTTVEKLLTKGVPDNVHLGKWSFRVCRNVWIDETRYRKIRVAPDADAENTTSQSVDGEKSMMNKIALSKVNLAMQELPSAQREALALVAIEGFTYAEASDILSVPVGTIMSRISRARKELSEKLDKSSLLGS